MFGPLGALVLRDALLREASPALTPPLTIYVCTRNRATLLWRCLAALVAMFEAGLKRGPAVDILAVDNAPSGNHTRQAAVDFPGVRYTMAPTHVLGASRHHALASIDRPWLAYVGDKQRKTRVTDRKSERGK